MKRTKYFILLSVAWACMVLCASVGYGAAKSKEWTDEQYDRALGFQDKYHSLYDSGVAAERNGQYRLAAAYFDEALRMVEGSGPETIFRSKLRDLQERAGNYDEALIHTEWFLEKSDPSSPIWPKFIEGKARLLEKIKESKTQTRDDSVKTNLRKLNREQQGFLIDAYSNENIEGMFKEVMKLEHAGKFEEALRKYEELLVHKKEIVDEFGIDAWVVLYPAIQRTAERVGNHDKEREALVWIDNHLLNPDGVHHGSLVKLEDRVVSHLRVRAQQLSVNS